MLYEVITVNQEKTPLSLLDSKDDWSLIRYTRTFMSPEVHFKTMATENSLQAYQMTVVDLQTDDKFWYPCDATFSQFVGDKISLRDVENNQPSFIRIRAAGLDGTDRAILNIVDKEGHGYGAEFRIADSRNNFV